MKTKRFLLWSSRPGVKSLLFAALFVAAGLSQADTVYVSYLSGSPGGGILAFAPSGASSVFATTYATSPMGLAIDSGGNLYAAVLDNTILKYTARGDVTVFASTGLNNPHAIAFDSMGNLYVGNYGDSTITKFTPDGIGSLFASAGVNSPQGLAFDSAGNLYVANESSRVIEKFSPTGIDLGIFATTSAPNGPHGLVFDSLGNLYVAEGYYNRGLIEKFTPDGGRSLFSDTGLADPFGLAFDSSGNLYVANLDSNTIVRFTQDGVGTVLASGLNKPTYITIIPEPSTLAVFICGLSAVLAFIRGKSKASAIDRSAQRRRIV